MKLQYWTQECVLTISRGSILGSRTELPYNVTRICGGNMGYGVCNVSKDDYMIFKMSKCKSLLCLCSLSLTSVLRL